MTLGKFFIKPRKPIRTFSLSLFDHPRVTFCRKNKSKKYFVVELADEIPHCKHVQTVIDGSHCFDKAIVVHTTYKIGHKSLPEKLHERDWCMEV